METLYRKVAVSEPSQFESNAHYYFVDFDGNIVQDKFLSHASFDEYTHRYKYFLEEIPATIKSDNTAVIEQLEAEKSELLEALEKANKAIMDCDWSENDGSPHLQSVYEENQSLIQKHKK